jgi:uncharacterized protein YbjT (DUF2867 family)
MPDHQRVLVAGATGYLGGFLTKELKRQGYWVRALSRDEQKAEPIQKHVDHVYLGEATKPGSIKGICKDIDIVFSTLGITRQRDGLTYMDVDYQANKNLLDEALRENVKKFAYVSGFNAHKLLHLQIVKAKERFVQELKKADIEHIIIRPNGFFSDMTEFLRMAERGRIYLFAKGRFQSNPIHGADLAQACVEHLGSSNSELDIGGPEILTLNEIASQAFAVLGKRPKITYIPLWIRTLLLKAVRLLTPVKIYGPIEFFMTVLAMDMKAPVYGSRTLQEHFRKVSEAANV